MERQSIERRNRALAIAQTKKRIQLRIRKADETYTHSAPCFKWIRKAILIGTYAWTLLDVWFSAVLFLAIVFKAPFIGLDVCICQYRCNHEWHKEFVKTNWNHTFVSDQCGQEAEAWTCQVQANWQNCACNEKGTSAAGNPLINVVDCNYIGLTGFYMLSNALNVVLGLVQTSSMFKLAQYSPEADPVNLGASVFFYLPRQLQRACHAAPSESKTYFYTYFGLFFSAWLIGAAIGIWEHTTEISFLDSSYNLPESFMKYQTDVNRLHYLSLVLQTGGLRFWLLGVEAHFKVRPRLREIRLKQPGEKVQSLFDCEVDAHKRKRAGAGGRHNDNGSSGSGSGQGGKGDWRSRALEHRARTKTLFRSHVQGFQDGGLGQGGKLLLTDLGSGLGGIGAGIGGFLGLARSGGDDDGGDDEEEVVVGDPIFLNVITGIAPSEDDDHDGQQQQQQLPDFRFRFKVDFVDQLGQRASPPRGLPQPLLTMYALPGEPEHAIVKQAKLTKAKSSANGVFNALFSWGPAVNTFDVQLSQGLVLGRHRLDLRLPLASSKTMQDINERASRSENNFNNNGGVNVRNNNSLHIGNSGCGRDSGSMGGPSSDDEGEADVEDQGEGEEFDSMLESCAHHEVVDVTLMDPEFDKRKLQALQERLESVEKSVAELAPQLEGIFARHATEEALEGAKAKIHKEPALHDYYVLLQMRIVGVAVACNAIASGMVGNEGPAGATASGVLKGASSLQFLGDHCGLPFAGVATALIGGVATAYAEYDKQKRVRYVQQLFYTPARADMIAEEVARIVVLRLRRQLRELEEEDSFNASRGGGGPSGSGGRANAAGCGGKGKGKGGNGGGGGGRIAALLKGAHDVIAMAEVAYADSEVKKKAEEDAQAIVDCIMSGRLDAALANAANARHEAHEEEEARAAGREEEKEGGGGDGGAIVVSSGGGGSNSGGERAGHLGAGQEDGGDHELIDILASFIAPPPLPGEEGADDTDDEEGGGKDISGGGAADTKANSAFVATASTHTKKPRSDLDRAASGPPLASSPSSAFHKKQPLRHWDNSRSNELSNNDQLTSRSSHNSRSSFEGGSQRGSLGSGNAADHTSIRSDSLNRAIDEYPAAVRYLKEGVEFTKTTYLATYRYSLKLNLESRRLEWSRVGGGKSSTKHSLVLDQHLSFLDDHEVGKGKDAADGNTPTSRKVSVVGVGGAATFTFPAASSAQQFKGCLQVVQNKLRSSHVNSGGGGGGNPALKSPLLTKTNRI